MWSMMDWTKVHSMQIDLTSHCNARCGACTRNIMGGPAKPELQLNHFDIKIWERLFTQDLKDTKLTNIVFNGMWGDPAMHPLLPEMITILYNSHPEVTITSLATNGGTHSPEYWSRLGAALKPFKYHRVDFAIDGLSDTHEMYRRRVKYERLMANAEAFIAAGGEAQWIMTVFNHNRHQISEAKDIARDMGFASITTRESNSSTVQIEDGDERYFMSNDQVQKSDYGYTGFKDVPFVEPTELNTGCPWYNQLRIQLDPWHKVWPCCHIAAQVIGDQWIKVKDPVTGEKIRVQEFNMQQEVYDQVDSKDFNDLTKHDFLAIMNSEWYQNYLTKKIQDKSLLVCDRNCGILTNGERSAQHNV